MIGWFYIGLLWVVLMLGLVWQTRHYCACSEPDPDVVGADARGPKFQCRRCGKKC